MVLIIDKLNVSVSISFLILLPESNYEIEAKYTFTSKCKYTIYDAI